MASKPTLGFPSKKVPRGSALGSSTRLRPQRLKGPGQSLLSAGRSLLFLGLKHRKLLKIIGYRRSSTDLRPSFWEIALYFRGYQGFEGADRFDLDCVRHHSLPSNQRFPGSVQKPSILRGRASPGRL